MSYLVYNFMCVHVRNEPNFIIFSHSFSSYPNSPCSEVHLFFSPLIWDAAFSYITEISTYSRILCSVALVFLFIHVVLVLLITVFWPQSNCRGARKYIAHFNIIMTSTYESMEMLLFTHFMIWRNVTIVLFPLPPCSLFIFIS